MVPVIVLERLISSPLSLALSLSSSLSESSGPVTSPFLIAQDIEPTYSTNITMSTIPAARRWKSSLNASEAAARIETASYRTVYRFELASKLRLSVLEKSKPREKAPSMLEIADPTTFPVARELRPRATENITTASSSHSAPAVG